MPVTSSDISKVSFSCDDVLLALSKLKGNKFDADGICCSHLKYASCVIADPWLIFSLLLCTIVTCLNVYETVCSLHIPKGNKHVSSSQNYQGIAIASNISKLLEHVILSNNESYLHTNDLNLVSNMVCLLTCVLVF